MKIWIENRKYYLHLRMISWYNVIRKIVGKLNSLFINTNKDHGKIKLHKWQFKLFKCVTADDVYIITGIYNKLIKPDICNGYTHYGVHNKTYNEIAEILCENYKWNKETMYGFKESAIRFTWMNFSPISIDNIKEWEIAWTKGDIRDGR